MVYLFKLCKEASTLKHFERSKTSA